MAVHLEVSLDLGLKAKAAVGAKSGQHVVKKADSRLHRNRSAGQIQRNGDIGFTRTAGNRSCS